MKFLVFMDADDSSEGLVKVATRKKVYKCLARSMLSYLDKVKHSTHLNVQA